MNAPAFTLPTIHLNGSDPAALRDGAIHAGRLLHLAYEALQLIAPHGRDYYPQGEGAIVKAGIEHRERLKSIDDILAYLEALEGHCQSVIDEKERLRGGRS